MPFIHASCLCLLHSIRGFIFLSLAACVILGGGKNVSAKELRLSTLAMGNSNQFKAFQKAGAEIAAKTDGAVTLKVYPAGISGTGDTLIRKIKLRQMEGGSFTVSEVAQYCPDLNVPSLSFMFNTYEEVDKVFPVLARSFDKALLDNGFVVLGYIETGFAYFMSTKPIATVEDIKQRNIWVQPDDWVAQLELKYFGVTPKTMSIAQATTGLNTGMVDTVVGPFIAAIGLQWFTAVKYIMDVPLVYTYSVILVSKKVFDRLSPEHQTIVKNAFAAQFQEALKKKTREENLAARKVLADKGIQFVRPPESEIQKIIDRMKPSKEAISQKGIMSHGIIGTTLQQVKTLRDDGNG